MKILLIGPQGSGKGTIGKLLSDKLKIPLVTTGKLLRKLPADYPHYKKIQDDLSKGKLLPTKQVGLILKHELKKKKYDKGLIIDGWCRKLSDLEMFDPDFDLVIYLDISRKTSIKRLTSRRVCEKKEHTYNVIYKPPKKSGVCDIDGSRLMHREDDVEEAINKRLDLFHTRTEKVISHFKKEGTLIKINAEPLPDKIFKNIVSKLGI